VSKVAKCDGCGTVAELERGPQSYSGTTAIVDGASIPKDWLLAAIRKHGGAGTKVVSGDFCSIKCLVATLNVAKDKAA
jgi:hypothetical protein